MKPDIKFMSITLNFLIEKVLQFMLDTCVFVVFWKTYRHAPVDLTLTVFCLVPSSQNQLFTLALGRKRMRWTGPILLCR